MKVKNKIRTYDAVIPGRADRRPFILARIAFFILLALVPEIVLYLPNTMMPGK